MVEKVKQEGRVAEIPDQLFMKLGETWDRCCDEFGIAKVTDIRNILHASSCSKCPVRSACERLWWEVDSGFYHRLTMAEYRQISQRFFRLKQERNRILEKRGFALPLPRKPA